MADEKNDEPEKRLTKEEKYALVDGAVVELEAIVQRLPNANLRGWAMINLVKNTLVREAMDAIQASPRNDYFPIMFKGICEKFEARIAELPEQIEELTQKHRAKTCDCIACALRRAIENPTMESLDDLLKRATRATEEKTEDKTIQ